ncbi:MAG TPA: peptidase U32 family protein [Candidatus Cloacimonadota bacterium]|nr:peptidase U32 family protein [Candidatus Cloacimonadota bacterium]
MKKPELLLPAGNADMAMCAFEGGADAVYAGIQQFNARQRARNFSLNEMYSLIQYAHQHQKKVYLTLNTLLKNKETFEVADILEQVTAMSPDAVIIQDWGIYYLLRHYFPELRIHASTQMGIHNSLGCSDAKKRGFERVVVARELTFHELEDITSKKETELELFIHGSLCYSMSGHCLFSSYLGGMSANRGMCKQPCRRLFSVSKEQHYLFSLKDLQLIDYIPQIMKLGIESLKIEGRMKSADYVYNTARAYRMVIDDNSRIQEAKNLLNKDLGRSKTSYFMGEDIHDVFSSPSVGAYIGRIEQIDFPLTSTKNPQKINCTIRLSSECDFHHYAKIRIVNQDDTDSDLIEIKEIRNEHNQKITEVKAGYPVNINFDLNLEYHKKEDLMINNQVYLVSDFQLGHVASLPVKKFIHQLKGTVKNRLIREQQKQIVSNFNDEHYMRIDNPGWLSIVNKDDFSKLIVAFTKRIWQDKQDFIALLENFKKDTFIELPLFIAEENISFYSSLVNELYKNGYTHFSISQVNQLLMFAGMENIKILANESIYTLNDFSIRFLNEQKVDRFIYPFEDDMDNLFTGRDRSGIIPLFFHPKLFFSRMPVNVKSETVFRDIKNEYSKYIRDGISNVVSRKPVSIYHFYDKLYKKGFRRFMTDLSFSNPSSEYYIKIIHGYYNTDKLPNSSAFNFKKGLW